MENLEIKEFNDSIVSSDDVKIFIYENYGTSTKHHSSIVYQGMKKKYGYLLFFIYLMVLLFIFFVSKIMFELTNRQLAKKLPNLGYVISAIMTLILFYLTIIHFLSGYTKILEKKNGYRYLIENEETIQETYMMNNDERFWIAMSEPKESEKPSLVGTIGIKKANLQNYPIGVFKPESKVGRLERLTVGPGYRNRGLGRSLLEYAMKWAKTKGYDYITADVYESNYSAMKVCMKVGLEKLNHQLVFQYLGLGSWTLVKKLDQIKEEA